MTPRISPEAFDEEDGAVIVVVTAFTACAAGQAERKDPS